MALKDLVIDHAEAVAHKIAAKYPLWPHETESLIRDIAAALSRRSNSRKAADEIERLRAKVVEWRQAAKVEAGLRREFFDKSERLRAALEEISSAPYSEGWLIACRALGHEQTAPQEPSEVTIRRMRDEWPDRLREPQK